MKYLVLISLFSLMFSCGINKLPKEKISAVQLEKSYTYSNDTLSIFVENSLRCPLRFLISSEHEQLNEILKPYKSILLSPLTDTTIILQVQKENQKEVKIGARYGDVNAEIGDKEILYPVPVGKSVKILQGNNSSPTHNTTSSRYAIDFTLAINDTICSATDGYVISVIDGYIHSGSSKKWKSYGNYVLTYEPETNRFFQYGHIVHKGSLVKQGDRIMAGQPIALSGMTGQVINTPHLHFNCFIPTKDGNSLQSHPVKFKSGIAGTSLKRGNRIKRSLPQSIN